MACHFAGDGGHELTVGFGVDILLLTSDQQVSQRGADDIGDLGRIHARRGGLGGTDGEGWQRFAPVKARLGTGGSADGVFEGDVFAEEREFGFHGDDLRRGVKGKGGTESGRVGGGRRVFLWFRKSGWVRTESVPN